MCFPDIRNFTSEYLTINRRDRERKGGLFGRPMYIPSEGVWCLGFMLCFSVGISGFVELLVLESYDVFESENGSWI